MCMLKVVGLAAFFLVSGTYNAGAQYFGAPPPPPPIFLPPPGTFNPSFQPGIAPQPQVGSRCATPYLVCFMQGMGPIQYPCLCPYMNGTVRGSIIP